jgi:hypothetical protein
LKENKWQCTKKQRCGEKMEKEIQTKNGISGAWVLKTLSISKQQKNEIAIK